MLEKVLNLLDIRDYFSAVVSAADLPMSKPHPEVYLKAASELSTKPINCVSLEDSFNGMISAKPQECALLLCLIASILMTLALA